MIVTGGLDTGAPANETTTLPDTARTACATTGVTELTGPYLLTLG
jgi:hypothetical protein